MPAEKIVVVLTGLLGDSLCRLSSVQALANAYPNCDLLAICSSEEMRQVLFQLDWFKDIIIFRKRHKYRDSVTTIRALRNFRASIFVDFSGGSKSMPFIALLSGARTRVGIARSLVSHLIFNRRVSPVTGQTHIIDIPAHILSGLGIRGVPRRWIFPKPRIPLTQLELQTADGPLDLPSDRDIVFYVGSNSLSRRPLDEILMGCLSGLLAHCGSTGRRLLLGGGSSDLAYLATICSGLDGAEVLPTLTLVQMGEVFSRAGLVICFDTGPSHIAIATARRVLKVFLSSRPDLFGPLEFDTPRYRALFKQELACQEFCNGDDPDRVHCKADCRSTLSADALLDATLDLLSENTGPTTTHEGS